MNIEAKVSWKSPSNIAFIKYWGKYGNQFPRNPSFSMTLSKSFTKTEVILGSKQNMEEIDLEFRFEDKKKEEFQNRIKNYLTSVISHYPFLAKYHIQINSENSFPHSAGIASSASAFSALALCLQSLKYGLDGYKIDEDFYHLASNYARLGSGSAARSVYGGYTIWGKNNFIANTTNDFAVPWNEKFHSNFENLHDTILILSDSKKSKSSSVGHQLMDKNPYAKVRYKDAEANFKTLLNSMINGDFKEFAYVLEHEALSLHGLMMMSKPWYSLLEPNSIKAIQLIQTFRDETNEKIAFTLDAGPNIHLIYPYKNEATDDFIKSYLKPLCSDGKLINDRQGNGPELVYSSFKEL